MSCLDDLCDFCGAYIDPIGGDGARRVRVGRKLKLWDGQCVAGMEAQWGGLSEKDLQALLNEHQTAYGEDPILWAEEVEATPRNLRRRIEQLDHLDTFWQLTAYQNTRRAAGKDDE